MKSEQWKAASFTTVYPLLCEYGTVGDNMHTGLWQCLDILEDKFP